jgi:hypothetical protein
MQKYAINHLVKALSDSTDLHPLPLVLLGPILRRAEEKQVCIWLACSKPVTIKAEIFTFEDLKISNLGGNQAKPVGQGLQHHYD